MLDIFFTVSQQVLILFIIMIIGIICTKAKFFSEEVINGIAKFVLYTVTPCVIINSFNREFDFSMLKGLGISLFVAFSVYAFSILIANLILKDSEESRILVLKFGTIFSNCGYMALPLQQALLGTDGVFYGAAYIAAFNLVNWTYGLWLMGGNGTKLTLKKIFINPGVIGVGIGLIFFLTPLSLPSVFSSVIVNLSNLNTPLPMLIVGFYISQIPSFAVLKDKNLIITIFFRLVIIPLCALGALFALGLRGPVFVSMVIAASAPSAVNTVMFAVMFKRDAKLAVTTVAFSTLLSVISMPLIVSLAMFLS